VTTPEARRLVAALEALVPADLRIGCRTIAAGDEAALLPEEARALPNIVAASRRASGTARHLARDLLARLGASPGPILRSPTGAPLWPSGFVGSLAHDETVAVAVVAHERDAAGLGIDVEPAEPLPEDVAALVVHAGDRLGDAGDRLATRLAFVAKEAVYKAVHPLCGEILDWPDIAVDLVGGRAVASTGHASELVVLREPRLVVVARVRPRP
jgi:4'-phosphopantetheinyl transferase EntD